MSAVMNSVYNNYLTTYGHRDVTRYDTHKKSELRNIYNSIVKLNKESPWYLPTTSKDTQQYAVNIKENARALHNTIANLGGLEENGLLDRKSASVSDPTVANAKYLGTGNLEDADPKFTLEVKNLASPQENTGTFLSDSKVDLPSDQYSFDIAINDMNYEFQFAVDSSETNRQVQERLARLINHADIGIKASISEVNDHSALHLVSEASGLPLGKKNIFRISDDQTSKTAGAVDYFGLNKVTSDASNARFLINGEERYAASNHFTVGKLFEVELKNTTPQGEPVTVGVKADVESLTENVTNLIGSYNSFMAATSSYLEFQSKSRQLLREVQGIANHYQPSLSSMGVQMNSDGILSVDDEKLKQTAQDSTDVRQTFGYLKDFSSMLLRKSNQISLNPMDYVDKKIVAYKNPGHNFVSPYATSAYSGMMFNGYC